MTARATWRRQQPLLAAWLRQRQQAMWPEWPAALDPQAPAVPAPPDAPRAPSQPVPGEALGAFTPQPPAGRVDAHVAALARAMARLAQRLAPMQATLLPQAAAGRWWPAPGPDARRVHPPLAQARLRARAGGLLVRPGEVLVSPPGHAGERLAALVPLWFWSERCGAVPGGLVALFAPPGPRPPGWLALTLCSHGRLHVERHGQPPVRDWAVLAAEAGLVPVHGPCPPLHAAGGAIAGRVLRV